MILILLIAMDKYYTKPEILDKIFDEIIEKGNENCIYIDFSCGNNYLGNKIAALGLPVVSYDIDPPAILTKPEQPIIKQDFLTVKPHNIGNCILFLNLPFGKNGTMARKFVEKSLSFFPLKMVLILPKINWTINTGYSHETRDLEENSFVLPNGKDFCWPTQLHIFKKLDDKINLCKLKVSKQHNTSYEKSS